MSTEKDSKVNKGSEEMAKEEYPPVPEAAIVKPEDEKPVKLQMRPEENLEERETDTGSADTGSEDMDGDGSPDWAPAVGPGV
ncbi:MAG TPA: hypothetical protein VJ695_04370 [Nitrososphaera sp.]|nr:hypothetical protein [Nitrososphaera sp.]